MSERVANHMKVPTPAEAEAYLVKAEVLNPGPWIQHSKFVAKAAKAIAARHPDLEPPIAYALGALHDIGRQAGVTDLRHAVDGYKFMKDQGFDDVARICLTHSFPVQDVEAGSGNWDGSTQERQFVQDYLAQIEYTDYDKLIQLCDALALPTGFCLIEKRLVDVALRRGLNEFTLAKWQAFFDLQQEFAEAIGCSIYAILPGIIENTFGIEIAATS